MGFEKVVLNKIEQVNPEAMASFTNGSLFLECVTAGDVYQITRALDEVVNARMIVNKIGDEYAIDFA